MNLLGALDEIASEVELADLEPDPGVDDGMSKPVENGTRTFGKSKDHRDHMPQVVIDGGHPRRDPVRCWTVPGKHR